MFLATNVSSPPKYEHLPVFKASLSSSFGGWEKYIEEVPDVSVLIKTLK